MRVGDCVVIVVVESASAHVCEECSLQGFSVDVCSHEMCWEIFDLNAFLGQQFFNPKKFDAHVLCLACGAVAFVRHRDG